MSGMIAIESQLSAIVKEVCELIKIYNLLPSSILNNVLFSSILAIMVLR